MPHQAGALLLPMTWAGQRLRKVQHTWSKPQQVSALEITAFKPLPSKEKSKPDSRASRPQIPINRELANDFWDLSTLRYCAAVTKNKVYLLTAAMERALSHSAK